MSNDSMGNLEKLGILVIVILVVVVGVVAITPEQTFFPDADRGNVADLSADDAADRADARSGDARDGDARDGEEPLPPVYVTPVKPEPPRPIWPDPAPPVKPDPVKPDPVIHVDPKPAPAPEPTPPSPAFREYKVQSGDSFYRIAERELLDVRRAKDIQAANPDVDPRRMRIGQTLRLPVGDAAVRGGGRRLSDDRLSGLPAPKSGATGRTYVVKPDDTAMGISSKLFGTVVHWEALLRHNGISDPAMLRVDTVLEVPEIPDAPRVSSNPAPEISQAPKAPSGERSYVVKKNDTLMGIASRQLDKAGRWREILDLNGLAAPADLRAGATIRIPAR